MKGGLVGATYAIPPLTSGQANRDDTTSPQMGDVMTNTHQNSARNPAGSRLLGLAAALIVALGLQLASLPAAASPGRPDRDEHPFVGMLVHDIGEGQVFPYCHATLISETEAVTAHHCAPTGSEVLLTFDNPVVNPAQLHTGTVLLGGFDFWEYDVDIAIIELHEPVDLPRYAQLPSEPVSYRPGQIFDFVTYISAKQSGLVGPPPCNCHPARPEPKYIQREPAHVEFDRNVIRTTSKQGNRRYETEETINMTTVTCYGSSGSPMFPRDSDVIAGVMSYGAYYCIGGGRSYFSRTDNELALGILTGTATRPPSPPPPPPPTEYPVLVTASGESGTLSFPATIRAGAKYTGEVTGLSPATATVGEVDEGGLAIFPFTLSKGFRSFTAVLRDDYTSGNDDLDLLLAWYVEGVPLPFFFSFGWTSEEGATFTSEDVSNIFGLDDPYYFEIWVHGWDTEGPSSVFTLFTREYGAGPGKGKPAVEPTIAAPNNPDVTIQMTWSGLDPSNPMYLGWIEHFVDEIPEEVWKSTVVAIDTTP
jgi:hypothetical protein